MSTEAARGANLSNLERLLYLYMTPERYEQINQLFHDALPLAGAARADFLRRQCGDDAALQRAVEGLLDAPVSEDFLAPNGLAVAARIFDEALPLPTGERAAFVQQACAGDETLRGMVDRMLAGHAQVGGLLDQPALAERPALAALAADLAAAPDVLSGQQFGHYEIIRRLGAGGMGEVYLARDLKLERQVALKILPREFTRDPDRVHRFAREAKAASALNHPNIITIHEIGTLATADGELHFIATEYIEGETLRQRLKRGRLTLAEALDAALQTAAALHAAHQAGIIHRDIKPENLMLRPDGYLKVLDFGLARINKPAQPSSDDSTTRRFLETHPGAVLGTISYMSPEQARGERVDGRTDLWSLGVVLYELLTGMRPFSAATLPDLMVALLEREPAPLSQHLPQVPPELTAVVDQALRKQAAERFQTAQAFGQALKALRREIEETVTSPPTPTPAPAAAEVLSEAPTRIFAKLTVPLAEQATVAAAANPALPLAVTAAKPARVWLPVALAVAIVGGLAVWRWLPAAPAVAPAPVATNAPVLPERSLSYLLTVQKVRDGQDYDAPYNSTGREVFENGWGFRFTFSSPQTGYVYVINEGPGAGGKAGYTVLFPRPGESARLTAIAPQPTRNYYFDQHKGTEKVWLIWATAAVPQLEALKSVFITDPAQAEVLRSFLQQHADRPFVAEQDAQSRLTTLRGRGDILAAAVSLEHQ